MALSNLRNEPRREITEQVLGVLTTAAFFGIDFGGAYWWNLKVSPLEWPYFLITMALIPMGLFAAVMLAILLAIITHGIGEAVCEVLDNWNLDPRPRLRRNRNTGEWR